jgi:hypothetical protein
MLVASGSHDRIIPTLSAYVLAQRLPNSSCIQTRSMVSCSSSTPSLNSTSRSFWKTPTEGEVRDSRRVRDVTTEHVETSILAPSEDLGGCRRRCSQSAARDALHAKSAYPGREMGITLRRGQGDYNTDYIPAERAWTPLDDVPPRIADFRPIWTTLDDPGQRAATFKTAVCRFERRFGLAGATARAAPICPLSHR